MDKLVRILIVEDMKTDFDLAQREIRKSVKNCKFQQVETREDFLNALETFQPDVILSDYSLPRFDGMTALKLALEHAPLTPFIIWTGSLSEDIAVECMKAGANNYILKENIRRLGPAVLHALDEGRLLLERKQGQEKLRESEERFRALIENSLENISLLAEDGTLLWENPAVNRTLGYPQDAYVGHNIFELMHPDDLEWTTERFTKLMKRPGETEYGIFRLQHQDGTWRWIEAIVTNLLNEPSVKATVINYRDITERKQAEIKIEQRNDDLRLINAINEAVIQGEGLDSIVNLLGKEVKRIFSGVGSTIYMLSPDEQYLIMQQYYMQPALATKIEQLIGGSIPLIHIPIREGSYFQKVLSSSQGMITSDPKEIQGWIAEFVETPFLPPAARGTIRKLIPQIHKLLNIKSIICVPLLSNGKAIGLMDISSSNLLTANDLKRIENIGGQLSAAIQRQQAIDKVRKSEGFLQSVQNALSASIAILNKEGTIIQVNSAWRKFGELNGLTHPESGIGMNYIDICDSATGPYAEDAPSVANAIREVITGQRGEVLIEYPCHSPKEKRWFVLHITKFEDGDQTWVVLAHENITERKRVEEDLKETGEQFRTLFEASPDAIMLVDPQGDWPILDCNTKACTMNGYTREELIGRSVNLFNLTQGAPDERAEYLAMVRQTDVLRYETMHKRKDGTIFPIEVSTSLISLGGREVILGIDRDITERKQSEIALRESEERFSNAFEYAPIGMAMVSPDGRWLRVNQAICELVGYSEDELLQKTFQDITHPEDMELDLYYVRQMLAGEIQSYQMEKRYLHKQGDTIWVLFSVSLVKEEDGTPLYFISQVQDITERKRAETALQASEERYRSLFEDVPVAIWEEDFSDLKRHLESLKQKGVKDFRTYFVSHPEAVAECSKMIKILDVNNTAIQMYEAGNKEDLIKETIQVLSSGEQEHNIDDLIAIAEGRNSNAWEGADETLTGSPIEISLNWSVVPGYEDDLSKIIVTTIDITERKRAEAQINELLTFNEKILNNSPIGIVAYKLTGECIFANGNVASIMGTDIEHLKSQNYHEIDSWKKSGLYDLVEKAALSNDALNSELHHVSTFGKDVWIAAYCVKFRSNEEDHMLLMISDITERKQADEQLKHSHSLLSTTLESTGDGILVVGPDRKISSFNRKFLELWRIPYNLAAKKDEPALLEFVLSQLKDPSTFISKVEQLYLSPEDTSLDELEFSDGRVFERYSQPQRLGTAIVGRVWSFRNITTRKRAENELRASEERFRQMADNIQEVFWITDAESKTDLYLSPAYEQLWGRPVEIQYQDPGAFLESVQPDDRAIVSTALEKQLHGERTALEYRITRPDGSIRWVWDRAFPILNETGKVSRVAGIAADITERKLADERLRESEERYRGLFENLVIGFALHEIVTNDEGSPVDYVFLEINPMFEQLTGIKADQAIGRRMTEVLAGTENDRFIQIYGKVALTGEPVNFEEYSTALGRYYEVNAYSPKRGQFAVTFADITERKQAGEQLRKLSRAVEQSASTIVITDFLGNIEYVNPKFTETTGYTIGEVIGENPRILKSDHTPPEVYKELWGRITSGEEWHGELHNKKKNGDLYWEQVTISPILNEKGETTHFVAVKEEITERKQIEKEIERHFAELEAVYENGLAVGRLLKPREIGDRVINTFTQYLSWHHVTIRILKDGSDNLELIAFSLPHMKEDDRSRTEQNFADRVNKVGQGMSGWVVQTGQPIRTGNVHNHQQYVDTYEGIQSGLYMPLMVGERVIGVISVESEKPDAFSLQDERLLATLANQAAIAFENARLYQEVQQELSERKRAQEALHTSESHYRELADSITDVFFELDQDLRYTHWNKASEALTGVAAEDAIGKTMSDIFGNSSEQSRIEGIYEHILGAHQPQTFETVFILRQGTRSFEINAYPSTRGVSVVAKDVTDRKRGEVIFQKRFELMEYSAHHSLEDLMQKITDEVGELTGSEIGFFHFMEDDQTTPGKQIWSTNALQLFHVPVSEGGHLPLDQAGVWADAARQRHSVIHNDYESLRHKKKLPEGHAKIVREMVIPIIRNDKIKAVLGFANKQQEYTQRDVENTERFADYAWDITERKQMEVTLATERNQLAKRVEERTAELIKANSNLARAIRVKDEFLANMSHELRTPLNAILGLSESLAEQIAGPLNDKQQKYITTIGESGHHLLSLINDILDLAKIEAGQITLDITRVDVNAVCQASLRMVKQLAQKKNQGISLEIDSDLGLMWADERRLKQMIVNLLSNAVKFTPQNGKIGLDIHGYRNDNMVELSVWDNGIGINDDDLSHLFQPFVQLDSGLARESTGTGLGLALVSQMARLHGGSISVRSEPGKGSRFTVTLPWEPAVAEAAIQRLHNTGKLNFPETHPKNKKDILLVEDTIEVTMMLKDYLETAGYNVTIAEDGIEGIEKAKLIHPDLILMDVQMPRMDGIETTKRLRDDPTFRYVPIIALTAQAMPIDRERCLEAGMNEYISKPVNLKALVKLIQKNLSNAEEKTRPQ